MVKSIAPMSTATAAATRTSALRANSGFNAYERVGLLGCMTVKKHSFSANKEMNEKEDKRDERGSRRLGEPSAIFSLFFGDIVIQGMDAPKCLRASLRVNLVQIEYRGGRLRGCTFLNALIGNDRKRYEGHTVVGWVGEEFSCVTGSWYGSRKTFSRVRASNSRRLAATVAK